MSPCVGRIPPAIVPPVRRSVLLFSCALVLAVGLPACGGSDDGKATPEPPARPSAEAEAAEGTPAPGDALTLPFPATTSTLISLPPGYKLETLLDGLEFPSAIAALPDGRLLIGEQERGRVRVVEDGRLQDDPWFEIPVSFAPNTFLQELGLVGVEVDPRFETNQFVYLYYTVLEENGQRHTVFARLRDVDGRGSDLTELVVIDLETERTHIAGSIAFNGDAILLGVGDHERASSAQDLSALNGKILRIDRDGKALRDNPFVGHPTADPRVYAYGVRNPFGIAVDQETGRAFFTDNRDIAGDALYELEPGANYGWPDNRVALREPLVIYQNPQGMADAIVYHGNVLPELDGDVLFCSFHGGGALHWSDPGELAGFDIYKRDRIIAPACNTGIAQGPDGFVYFLDYGEGRLLRISR